MIDNQESLDDTDNVYRYDAIPVRTLVLSTLVSIPRPWRSTLHRRKSAATHTTEPWITLPE
jgi:hypothetical protein